MNTFFSDSSDADSAKSSLKLRSSQKSRDSNIDVQYPLVSHSITPNQPAFTDIGHTTIVDKEKMNIGAVLLIEDHRVHGLRESQLPENGESKEGNEVTKEFNPRPPLGGFTMLLSFRNHSVAKSTLGFLCLCNLQANRIPFSKT